MDIEIHPNKYAKLTLNHKIDDFSTIFERCKNSGVKFLILVDNTLRDDVKDIINGVTQYYYTYNFQPYVSYFHSSLHEYCYDNTTIEQVSQFLLDRQVKNLEKLKNWKLSIFYNHVKEHTNIKPSDYNIEDFDAIINEITDNESLNYLYDTLLDTDIIFNELIYLF